MFCFTWSVFRIEPVAVAKMAVPIQSHLARSIEMSRGEIIWPPKTLRSPSCSHLLRLCKDTDKLEGLFTLYRHKETGKIYLELKRAS